MTPVDWQQAVAMAVACAVFYVAGLMAASRRKPAYLTLEWRDLDILKRLEFGGRDGVYGLTIKEYLKIGSWRGSIYPMLHDLEDRGLIESWEETPGPDERRLIPRRLYRVSAYGLDLLTAIRKKGVQDMITR